MLTIKNKYRSRAHSPNVLLILIAFFFVFSCAEEEIYEPVTDQPLDEYHSTYNTAIQDGKLKFSSKEAITYFMESDKEDREAYIRAMTASGFKSLRPFYHENEPDKIDRFLAEKQERIRTKGLLYSDKSEDEYNLDLDDELIMDPYFASILNENREIYVGDELYIYTTKGVYVSKIEKEAVLQEYLKNLEAKMVANDIMSVPGICEYKVDTGEKPQATEGGGLSLSQVEMVPVAVTEDITLYSNEDLDMYEDDPCNSGGGTGGGGTGGGGTGGGGTGGGSTGGSGTAGTYPLVVPQSFQDCAYAQNSLWQQAFGNRVKCNDYHDGKHRVQTQFWNQNFVLFKSLGTKVKYQRKRFIGWSESTAADYVELGINYIKYKYKNPISHPTSLYDNEVVFQYKGYTVNSTGQVIGWPAASSNWPFVNPQQTFFELKVFSVDVDYGDVNSAINTLLGLARQNLPGWLNLENDLNLNKVGLQYAKILSNETEIIVANKVGRHGSNYQHNFEFDFLLSWSSDDDFWDNFFKSLLWKPYDVMEVDIYGMAPKSGVIKGRRVRGSD